MFIFLLAQLRKGLTISPSLIVVLLLMQMVCLIWKWGTAVVALLKVRLVLCTFWVQDLIVNFGLINSANLNIEW